MEASFPDLGTNPLSPSLTNSRMGTVKASIPQPFILGTVGLFGISDPFRGLLPHAGGLLEFYLIHQAILNPGPAGTNSAVEWRTVGHPPARGRFSRTLGDPIETFSLGTASGDPAGLAPGQRDTAGLLYRKSNEARDDLSGLGFPRSLL